MTVCFTEMVINNKRYYLVPKLNNNKFSQILIPYNDLNKPIYGKFKKFYILGMN